MKIIVLYDDEIKNNQVNGIKVKRVECLTEIYKAESFAIEFHEKTKKMIFKKDSNQISVYDNRIKKIEVIK